MILIIFSFWLYVRKIFGRGIATYVIRKWKIENSLERNEIVCRHNSSNVSYLRKKDIQERNADEDDTGENPEGLWKRKHFECNDENDEEGIANTDGITFQHGPVRCWIENIHEEAWESLYSKLEEYDMETEENSFDDTDWVMIEEN